MGLRRNGGSEMNQHHQAESKPSSEQLHECSWLHGDPHVKYKFLRVLGTGHFGTTFLCSNLSCGELVAIKALDKHHPEYERKQAIEEIGILSSVCDMPNIVTLYEIWEDGNYIYLVMEACLGGELFDLILEKGHFTELDAAQIVKVVLQVIQHCHLKGIIHRDLKPENFLLKNQESELKTYNLRAIDFGLSKFLQPDESCHSCVGSSYYVAPEVLRGTYSWAADLWSVGVITYILLSGFPPFWGSSDYMIFQRILENNVDFDYQPWQQISEPAKDFVGRLLVKDPALRMTLPEALHHPWMTDHAAVPNLPLDPTIFGRLQAFTHQNRVKCLLMTVAARHLSDTAIGNLKEVFAYVDQDHDGMIDMKDLTLALSHAGVDLEKQGEAFTLEGLDLAHHGKVHVDEFIAAALDQRKIMTSKTINTIFAQLDHDNDGFLHMEELSKALADCKISIEADTLERLIQREGLLDKKGKISAKSFQSLLLSSNANPMQLETYLQDVQRFATANHFKQLAMLVIARNMEPQEVEGLRELFHRLDEDGTGTINAAQLKEAMAHMGKLVGEAELQNLLEALDLKHHGVIEYDSFLAAALEEQELVTEAKMRAAFNFFDKTHEGFITKEDLVQVLSELGMDPAGVPSKNAAYSADNLMQLADTDRDAKITYEDFKRLLLMQPENVLTQAPSAALNMLSRSSSRANPSRQSSNLVDLMGMIEDAWLTSPKKVIPLSPSGSRPLRITTPRTSPRGSLDSPGRNAAIAAAIAATSPRSTQGSQDNGAPEGSSFCGRSPSARACGRVHTSPFAQGGTGDHEAAMASCMDMMRSLSRHGTSPGTWDLQQFSSSGPRSRGSSSQASPLAAPLTQPLAAQQQQHGVHLIERGSHSHAPKFCEPPTFMLDVRAPNGGAPLGTSGASAAAPLLRRDGAEQRANSLSMSGGFGSHLDLHSDLEASPAGAGGTPGSGRGECRSLLGQQAPSGTLQGSAGMGSSSARTQDVLQQMAGSSTLGLTHRLKASPYGGMSALQGASREQDAKEIVKNGTGAANEGKPGLLTKGFLLSGVLGSGENDPFRMHPAVRSSREVQRQSVESTGSDSVWLGGD